ncbi:glycoside hydrolase family 26 protein [Cellulomonas sp. ICMP 17802]|uniref:glycoside hydrolase family 26 protein n=1 Tax=Cellulomonas sp. ICMP 17802 TaxID=3239199 RepID=UPI00351B02A9
MSEHIENSGWWSRAIRPSPRKRLGAAGIALALVAVTAGVWLSPSVASPSSPKVSAAELRLAAENEKLRNSLQARQDEVDSLERSQAKAAAERKAASESGKAKAAAEQAAAAAEGAQKAEAERAAAAARSQGKAAAEKAAAAAKGKAQAAADRADQAEADAARARAAVQASAPQPATPAPAVKPTAPPVSALIAPAKRQFGLYTPQSPFNWAELDSVSASVGSAPTIAGYFQGWDGPFRADAVTRSWQKGMLPLLTWESRPLSAGNNESVDPAYSLPTIIGGQYDAYLHQYAKDIAALGLPMAIRLDHEMNGDWYPWGERTWNGDSLNGNAQGDYVKMWRHVHDIFEAEGANQYVIWVWAPNIVNSLATYAKQDATYMRSLYPGDEYVDWVGLSGYYRPPYKADQTPTFSYTYDRSLDQLRSITTKPIFLAEVGASEVGGNKPAWVADLFHSLAKPENADVIGFAWFNHTVTTTSGGELVTNDWRIGSRADSLKAFSDGLHDPAANFAITTPTS